MKRVWMIGSVFLLLILASCSSPQTLYMCSDGTAGGGSVPDQSKEIVYVCPNGEEVTAYSECEYTNIFIISQKEAETKSINFVNGYVRSSGWSGTLINVYPQEGHFYGQVVISKSGEQSYETTVKIDGERGTVTCEQNCLYTTQIG